MTDPQDPAVIPQVGHTVLGFLIQALSWLAFGLCFGLGFYLSQIMGRHIVT